MRSAKKIAAIAIGLLVSVPSAAQIEGFTEPARTVEIGTPETGLVGKLLISEGARVSKGDVVAVLDSRLLKAAMAVAEARMKATAGVEAAQARYEQTRERRARIEELKSRGSARDDEVIRAKSEAAIAVAELRGATERQEVAALEYERLKAQIGRRTITSPISGVVVKIVREQGELVNAGQPVIAEIAELSRLNVVSHIPEARVRSLKTGSTLTVKLADGARVAGKVGFIAPTVDPRSGTVEVKVLLENPDGALRSGTRASLALGSVGSANGLSHDAASDVGRQTAQN